MNVYSLPALIVFSNSLHLNFILSTRAVHAKQYMLDTHVSLSLPYCSSLSLSLSLNSALTRLWKSSSYFLLPLLHSPPPSLSLLPPSPSSLLPPPSSLLHLIILAEAILACGRGSSEELDCIFYLIIIM